MRKNSEQKFTEESAKQPKEADNLREGEVSLSNENGFTDRKFINLPKVVIVGRPNVGKSTLFNRFMNRRIAIVDPTAGVTREGKKGTCFISGKPVELFDTGGYKLTRLKETKKQEREKNLLDEETIERTVLQAKSASVILLVMEADEITAEDEHLIEKLRKDFNKIIAVVNKTEGDRMKNEAWNNVGQFGFKKLFFISASHGDNISSLSQAIISRLDFSGVKEITPEKAIKIAILGKPNTGKSTLFNQLTKKETSLVSEIAGTTRDSLEEEFFYKNQRFIVVDTAGIRRKAKVKENVEYYSVNRAIKEIRECDVVFLLMNADENLSEQDKKIAELATKMGRGIIFVLNKWDKQEQTKARKKEKIEWIKIMFGKMSWAPILVISALYKKGLHELLNTTMALYKELNKKIDTTSLNIALEDWLTSHPPPASKISKFKIRYATQISVNPVKFLFFATRPNLISEQYISYLENSARRDLGFSQIPISIEMKASRKKWEKRRFSKE